MNKNAISKLIKNIILSFVVFNVGFIGTMLVINHRATNISGEIVNAQVATIDYVSLFGLEIMEFCSYYEGEIYIIDITKIEYYNSIPIIAGLLLLLVVVTLSTLTKFLISKNEENN